LQSALQLPVGFDGWLRNLAIFGLTVDQPSRLIATAWSLNVELIFYVLMGAGLARHRHGVAAWFAARVAYTAWLLLQHAPDRDLYFPVAAASLPFSTGALLCHYREPLRRSLPAVLLPLVAVVFVVNAVAAPTLWTRIYREGFYLSLALAAVLLLCLSRTDGSALSPRLACLDRRLGDLSYPIFLSHLTAAVTTAWIQRSLGFGSRLVAGAVFVVLMHAVAIGLHAAIERPIATVRTRVRAA
jgi:peptidoglycan/LPS O-acetylase OafA/YrhL